MSAIKSVAIVGAGPGGLVAAKTLIHDYPGGFKVTIFEQKDRVGGMWGVRKYEPGIKCNPLMSTNLSKFTVSFSDLHWGAVELEDGSNEGSDTETPFVPMFPKAWQVGKYLETYTRKYLSDATINFGAKVVKADRTSSESEKKWKILWNASRDGQDNNSNAQEISFSSLFDYLIIASGFFSSPMPLTTDMLAASSGNASFPTKVQHSSEFSSLAELLPSNTHQSGNVVVVGGGMSGVEMATVVAAELSDQKHSPSPANNFGDLKVYHISSRPFYCLPRYLVKKNSNPTEIQNDTAPTFIPLDMCLNDLSRRPEGAIRASNGLMPPDKASKTHAYLQTLLGGDQSELGASELVPNSEEKTKPAFVAPTDNYYEFVRSGEIIPVRGRMTMLLSEGRENQQDGIVTISHTNESKSPTQILNVVALIDARGFVSSDAVSWLSDEVLEKLEFSRDCPRLPLILQDASTFSDTVPELAFVGFYQGPYWGVMEMQSRLIGQKWASSATSTEPSISDSEPSKEKDSLRHLRTAMMQQHSNVPQFWMGDYVGLMEELSDKLGIKRSMAGWDERCGPCFPARYTSSRSDQKEADLIIQNVHSSLNASVEQTNFVGAAIFRQLQGVWTLRRKLESRLPGFPSGILEGTAHFYLRKPTDPDFDQEYLYFEQGTLKTDSGYNLTANRRYVYRYQEKTDKITTWFVKDDGKTVDYFFNQMDFKPRTASDSGKGWLAEGTHLCEKDNYDSFYEFRFKAVLLELFNITYKVKGPKKDYTSESWYERPIKKS